MKAFTTFAALLFVSSLAASEVMENPQTGSIQPKRINVIHFAPGGVLLIGDGPAAAIYAVETGDTAAAPGAFQPVTGFEAELAARLGIAREDLEVIDMEVNPASKNLYVAVLNKKTSASVLVRVKPNKEMEPVSLQNVRYVRVPLPAGDKAPVSAIADIVWIDGRLIAAARCAEEFASKIFSADGPLQHDRAGQIYSAETYHISHGKWETKAPMSVMIPYEENGQHYVIGAFSCTPVVKYPIDAIQPGAVIKGISMIELGSGNRPLDMFSYKKDGVSRVLTNTYRFHHEKRPFGPSPHLAFSFEESLLGGDKVNENATRRLQGNDPAAEKISIAEGFHGVVKMSQLDDKSALALNEAGDLVTIALP